MATFERVPVGKAPPRPANTQPAALQSRMRAFEGYAADLGEGEVGVLEPEHGETTRGLAMRMSRAGKRLDRTVNSWTFDGKVYFKVESAPAKKKAKAKGLELGR